MRYFLELSYKGTNYAGFQIQENARTVQWELERALSVLLRKPVALTGSSRTDAGVHALQNYFHLDLPEAIPEGYIYKLNAILPPDIAVRSLRQVKDTAHCRFDAISRAYHYQLYHQKDPFVEDRAWFMPYPLDGKMLQRSASIVLEQRDFTAFAKRNSQVKTFQCTIMESSWTLEQGGWAYRVKANRFLRGMVRGLVGTMVEAGRGRLDEAGFHSIFASGDNQQANFTAPGKGLSLVAIDYPPEIWF